MPMDKNTIEGLINGLKRQRDELALKIHLGKAEAQCEWEKVEEKLNALRDEYRPVKEAVEETAEGVLSALELTANEVKTGLERVKKLL
jgi:hypothetical protein